MLGKGLRVLVTWLIVVSFLVGLIPITSQVSAQTAPNNLVWPNAGAVNLKKEALPTGNPGEWKVTLTVEGKNIQTTTDVVLVIDKSGSMAWDGPGTTGPKSYGNSWKDESKMTKAKTAAKQFVDSLLQQNSTTRIAAISFSDVANKLSDFMDVNNKDALKTAINTISPNGGTNIQAGIHQASELLKSSHADNKFIVLLSDGQPTYSFKAKHIGSYTFPSGSTFGSGLKDFEYTTRMGAGNNYYITPYTVNGFQVKDNGIGTVSEAKLAQGQGIHMYSIGLDVGNDPIATKVLSNTQDKGYYPSSGTGLDDVFKELSSKIAYAAQNAKVTDPMGAMFNKVDNPIVSQGTLNNDANLETIYWDIGNIIEGTPATMSYTVELDYSKNPDPNTLYPTNGKTTMDYTDVYGISASKDFEVPKVVFGKGSILIKGSRVNAAGDPVNDSNVIVDRPDQAAQLYSDPFKDSNGNEALDVNQKYSVPAKDVPGYQLKVGNSTEEITPTVSEPNKIVWFGYTILPHTLKVEYKARNVDLGNGINVAKIQGEKVDVQSKGFAGYKLKDVNLSNNGLTNTNGHVTGDMPDQDTTITYNYEANAQKVKVKYLLEGTTQNVAPSTVVSGVTGGKTTLTALDVAGYSVVGGKTNEYTFTADQSQEFIFYYIPAKQQVTVKYLEKGNNRELSPATVSDGTTGGTVELDAKSIAGYQVDQAKITYRFTTDAKQEVDFYYTPAKQQVTVKYLEKGSNRELSPSKVEAGVTSKSIDLKAKPIAGYQVDQSKITYSFTADAKQEVIFHYTTVQQQVTVKYLEKGTNKELSPPMLVKGVTSEVIKLNAKKVPGYDVDQQMITYTFNTNANQGVIFYYTPVEQQVVVKYVEKGSLKELSPATVEAGATSKNIVLKAKAIAGYKAVQAAINYTFNSNVNQDVVFYYTPEEQQVTVKYLEKGTNKELAPVSVMRSKTSDKIKIEAKSIAGYLVDQPVKTHTFTANAKQEVIFYYTADKQQVTVKYLEKGANKKLEAETTVAGVTREIAKLLAKKIPGYQAEQSVIEHKFNEDAMQEEIFYYTASKEKVLVKYLEKGTNKELKPETSAVGVTGETIKLDAAKIPGYQTDRATIAYTFNSNATQEVIFYYTPANEQVTVRYLEQGTNKELAPSTGEKGNTGEKIKLQAASIPGYLVDEAVKTHTFTTNAKQEVIFYYTADKQKVTVKYVDKATNNEIDPATSTKGTTGATINLQAKSIAGYIPEQTSMSYTFNSDPAQEVIFYYTAGQETVTVKYLERDTNKVLEASTVEAGVAGEMIKLNAKKVAGYQAEQPVIAYKFSGDADQEVIFYYTAGEEKMIVKYLEQGTDNELAPVSVLRGTTGDIIKLLAEIIPGYKVDQERKTHTFNSVENQEEDFYYTPNKETVTVKYLEKGTKQELGPSTFSNGIFGETIKLDAEDIPGYTVVGNNVQNFTFNDDAHQVVVFLYSKNVPSVEKRTITVNYVDRVSNLALKEPKLYGGEAGKTIHLTAEPISVHSAVYDVVYAPENYDFNYLVTDVKVQNYTFYYNLDHSGDIQKVIIHHVYMDGDKKIELAVEEKEGKQGDTITMSPDLITKDGIVYRPVKDEYAYTFTSEPSQSYEIFYSIDEVPIEKEYQGTNNGSSNSNLPSGTTALPPVPVTALPPVPLKLEKEQHINYIKGYPDGMIKPENFISREEIAAIFYRLLDNESRNSYMKLDSSFKDIGNGRWSNRHIATLANAGIITGYGDGSFKPGQKITRAEFAAIASRFDKLDVSKNDMFSDIKGHWAEKYVLSSANKGWIKGYQDGTFKPNQYITRAEAMAFINSVLNRKVKAEGIDEDAKQWPDNLVSKWYYADVMEATTNHLYTRDEDGFETWQEIKPDYVYPE